jgi:cytochrome c1
MRRMIAALLLLAAPLALAGCDSGEGIAETSPIGGNPHRGADLIVKSNCGLCHEIPGITGAEGHVGPPLDHMAVRTIIAGFLPNTPENMRAWLRNPQAAVPGNAMPNMELKDDEAEDITAYLYTLR